MILCGGVIAGGEDCNTGTLFTRNVDPEPVGSYFSVDAELQVPACRKMSS